jgi:two-component system nitrogen regulation sensor histidine kinase NtrY
MTRRPARHRGKRVTTVVLLSILVLLLLLSLIAQSGFNLSPLVMPESTSETLLLYALTTLNFLAFVTVLFVLLRNVLKLVRERRSNRLGSKFKTRLVSYSIGLSLLPALLLFFFAFGLLNRSIDRWFGEPARQIVDDARNIEESYFKKEQDELVGIARVISRNLELGSKSELSNPDLDDHLRGEITQYGIALARVIGPEGRRTVKADDSLQVGEIEETLTAAEQSLIAGKESFVGSDEAASPTSIYLIAAIPVAQSPQGKRLLVLAQEYPQELTERTLHISEQHERFHSLLGKIKRIKSIYILLLAAVTLLLIFSATWLALYVARGITVPIQALAEATDRIARGDFSRPVEVVADDELAVLVNSFNDMSGMLAENRHRLVRAADDLTRTNLALEDRRRYIETVLESLSTGVVSVDSNLGIAFVNRSALWMLGLNEKPALGTPIVDLIPGRNAEDLAALCRRARRTESSHAELEITRADGRSLVTATTAIALRSSEGAVEGWVIVIEDLTDLIQAERAAAWSEVARRMAHEIKNPLTPIQLSAERILKNYTRLPATTGSRLDQVVREGTSTIVREVAALQRMVEEFSRFARLPESKPAQTRLNEVITAAVSLYTDRLNGITLESDLASDIPALLLDPEQIKRVLVNLIDNAIEALETDSQNGGNGSRQDRRITVEARYLKENEVVTVVVSDNGHGIRPRDRDKLFLPKFSTRERGTGLGLAIVSHIVADHKGRIWFEDNKPRGARFIIELPVTRFE